MMRAAVLTGPGQVDIERVPVPEPGATQVRIRVEGCGVCASNIVPWEGPEWMRFPTQPGELGHEGWGVIDSLGDDVAGLEVGKRVAMLSGNAYAEYDLAPASAVVPLPESLGKADIPLEPFGCAMNIFRRSDICAGQTVAIIGIGFLGATLTKLATHAGAHVIAISRRLESLELGKKMGAAEPIPMDDHTGLVERVRVLTRGQMCERVIECVGKQWPLDLAGELCAEGGRLIIAGYHQDGPRQVNMQLWNWRGLDVINAHERDPQVALEGMREALVAIESRLIDPEALVTHRYPLERVGEAFNATRDRPGNFVKAVILP